MGLSLFVRISNSNRSDLGRPRAVAGCSGNPEPPDIVGCTSEIVRGAAENENSATKSLKPLPAPMSHALRKKKSLLPGSGCQPLPGAEQATSHPQSKGRISSRMTKQSLALLCAAVGCYTAAVDPPIDPPTAMTTITVPDAVARGAVMPNGAPWQYQLNHTGSTGWIIHMSGGGWIFMKNSSGSSHHADGISPRANETMGLDDDHGVGSGANGCYGICDGIRMPAHVSTPTCLRPCIFTHMPRPMFARYHVERCCEQP